MLLRMLSLLLVLFSANLHASVFPIEIIEYIDNTKVVTFINESDIDKTLHWIPFEGSPPLTIADALKAVRQHVAPDADLANATLTGIELKQIPRHTQHWHYLVKMKSQANDKIRQHYFIVLMNGKVITGLKEPESFK